MRPLGYEPKLEIALGYPQFGYKIGDNELRTSVFGHNLVTFLVAVEVDNSRDRLQKLA